MLSLQKSAIFLCDLASILYKIMSLIGVKHHGILQNDIMSTYRNKISSFPQEITCQNVFPVFNLLNRSPSISTHGFSK